RPRSGEARSVARGSVISWAMLVGLLRAASERTGSIYGVLMTRRWLPLLLGTTLALAFGASPGCSCDSSPGHLPGNGDGGDNGDGGGGGNGDGGPLNACGDNDPSCSVSCLGPTCTPPGMFPLPSDS